MKRTCILYFLILLTTLVWAQENSILTQQEALIIVQNQIVGAKSDSVNIYASNSIIPANSTIPTIYGQEMSPTFASWLFFIDDFPFASWSHPCRFVFVDIRNGQYEVYNKRRPPVLQNMTLLSEQRIAVNDMPLKRKSKIKKISEYAETDVSNHNYAVIINGGIDKNWNEERYWNHCSFIYKVLHEKYGYPKDHIYVIMSDGTDPAADRHLINGSIDSSPLDLDGDGLADIQYSATKANIYSVFNTLENTLTNEDNLFVFTTDHGDQDNGHHVFMYLWNNEILHDYEFAELIDPINATINICMVQCNSGGFIDDITRENVVITTSCRYDESAYAMIPPTYSEFAYHWISALAGETPDGDNVDADYNNDGIVSMHEAFTYASNHDTKNEHPQYSSTPSGWGDFIYLNPNTITGDSILEQTGVYKVLPLLNNSFTISWSIDNPAFTLTPSGQKCTVTYNQGLQYDTATLTAVVMKGGVVLRTLTKHIENVGEIVGDSAPCSLSVYNRATLPDTFSVSWSINNTSFSITPNGTQCTVAYNSSPQYDTANLMATISKNGQTVKTLTKRIVMHGTSLFVEGEQSGIYDENGDIRPNGDCPWQAAA